MLTLAVLELKFVCLLGPLSVWWKVFVGIFSLVNYDVIPVNFACLQPLLGVGVVILSIW